MAQSYTPGEPIAAIATPLAPSALGIVRASGNGCIELLAKLFSRPEALCTAQGNSIVYGWIADGANKIDEVLVSVFRAPKSFTGEDMAEISCHGGPSIVTAIYNLLISHGFRSAERGEFTFRAYVNGKSDLTKAEAVREIIESRTDEARGHAAGRLAGSLYHEIDAVKKLIIAALASIEVAVEYPEDEETIADSFDTAGIQLAQARLQMLADSWQSEKLYQDGARVVLCGKTNAGKSSLFNTLLKEERAIVSDIAGTTRDWLESWADFSGIPVRLFDTAGLRKTADEVEKQGVALAHSLTHDADVVLYVIDSTEGYTEDDAQFLRPCAERIVVVWNKCDVAQNQVRLSDAQKKLIKNLHGEIAVSAKNGTNIAALVEAVWAVLTSGMATERVQAGLCASKSRHCRCA